MYQPKISPSVKEQKRCINQSAIPGLWSLFYSSYMQVKCPYINFLKKNSSIILPSTFSPKRTSASKFLHSSLILIYN